MVRTFNRLRKQVDDRRQFRRPRGNAHVLLHDLLVYALEVKTFHVKQFAARPDGSALTESEKDLLVAGEQLEERTKAWLAGDETATRG